MERKKILIADLILIAIFVSIIIVALQIAKNWGVAERLALVSIIIAIAVGVIHMINSLLKEVPKFEVSNPRVETERSKDRVSKVIIPKTGTPETLSKVVYLDVKNKNPDADLVGCKLTIVTKSSKWDIENLDNLITDASKPICLFRVLRNEPFISPYQYNKVKLNWGESYDLDLRFYGKNFVNKKVWRLELDFTSWDSCNLRFKTHREVLKDKIRGRKDE